METDRQVGSKPRGGGGGAAVLFLWRTCWGSLWVLVAAAGPWTEAAPADSGWRSPGILTGV